MTCLGERPLSWTPATRGGGGRCKHRGLPALHIESMPGQIRGESPAMQAASIAWIILEAVQVEQRLYLLSKSSELGDLQGSEWLRMGLASAQREREPEPGIT
jgi:hypothetical protein